MYEILGNITFVTGVDPYDEGYEMNKWQSDYAICEITYRSGIFNDIYIDLLKSEKSGHGKLLFKGSQLINHLIL